MSTATASVIVIGLFLVFQLAFGLWVNRGSKQDTPDEYFLMSKNINWFLLLWTTLATYQSANAFLGSAGSYLKNGIGFVILVVSGSIITPALWLTIGTRLRTLAGQKGYITINDYLEERYDSRVAGAIGSIIGIIIVFVFLVCQMVGSAHALVGATGGTMSFPLAVFLLAIFVGVYTIVGGMKAVVYTDLVQGIFFHLCLVAIIFIALFMVPGGISGAFKLALKQQPALLSRPGPLNLYTDWGWVGYCVFMPIAMLFTPHTQSRIFAAKDPKGLATSSIGIVVSNFIIFGVMAIFAAFGSLVVLGPLSTPDQAVPLLLGKWLPWWLVAIMMAGAIAAASSTVDSLILSGSQYVFNDWVFRSKRYNPRNFKFIGRLVTLIMVIVSSLLSLKPPSYIYDIQNHYFYPGMSQVMPAVFAAMYWPRANKYGAIAGMVVGSSLVVLFDRLKIASILGIPGNFVAFILNIVLLIVISLVTPADVQKSKQTNLLQTSGD